MSRRLRTLRPPRPRNALDPRLRIIGPGGQEIASDDNSAADGRNARVGFVAPEAGTYLVEVAAESGPGEYLLRVHRAAAEVVGRHVFYNNSKFDGGSPLPSTDDESAMAPSPSIYGHGHEGEAQ